MRGGEWSVLGRTDHSMGGSGYTPTGIRAD